MDLKKGKKGMAHYKDSTRPADAPSHMTRDKTYENGAVRDIPSRGEANLEEQRVTFFHGICTLLYLTQGWKRVSTNGTPRELSEKRPEDGTLRLR